MTGAAEGIGTDVGSLGCETDADSDFLVEDNSCFAEL